MVVDIAPQQQLPEIFTTNRNHHCSTSSNTHRRNSTATTINTNHTTMTNGHRFVEAELSKKAELILGQAPPVFDYNRQASFDCAISGPVRLNIRSTLQVNPTVPVNTHQTLSVPTIDISMIKKGKCSATVEQLVQSILKLAILPNMTRLPETISRHSKPTDNVMESDDDSVKLSDDENDDDSETIDNKYPNDNINQNQMKYSPIDTVNRDTDEDMSTQSDAENDDDDESNQLNPNTFSLSYFVRETRLPLEVSQTIEQQRSSPLPLEPPKAIPRKQELIRSFSSSVNIPIDMKQPTLPITLPKHLFFDLSSRIQDDQMIEKSKRYADGSIKRDSSISDDHGLTSTTVNGSIPKKTKTSHINEKTACKQEPSSISTAITMKTEPFVISDSSSVSGTVATISNKPIATPMVVQPQREKPTASVKPLLQSTSTDNSSATNTTSNMVNPSDRLTTTNPTSGNPSKTLHYDRLKNMSIKQLNSLARQKKKQADTHRRSTFEEIRQSMSLYLESVCYFIQCAHDEPVIDQRMALLTTILPMLQHLVQNHQKMFQISNNQSVDLLFNLRQQFLLINYWLQSFIYQLQYQTNWSSIERCASQVTDYFHQYKSPLSTNTSDTANTQFIYDFSKYMLISYQSNSYWNKADRLMRDTSLKEFLEQLLRQNQNRRLTRDEKTFDFILYIFDAIDLLRLTVA